MSEAFDLYADENEPFCFTSHTTYGLRLPHPAKFKTGEQPYVYVDVDTYGMVNIDRYRTRWFGVDLLDSHGSRSVHSLEKEIYEWLVEWELAEWKSIGPEDRELFATKKLTGKELSYE